MWKSSCHPSVQAILCHTSTQKTALVPGSESQAAPAKNWVIIFIDNHHGIKIWQAALPVWTHTHTHTAGDPLQFSCHTRNKQAVWTTG